MSHAIKAAARCRRRSNSRSNSGRSRCSFLSYSKFGIFAATGVMMASVLVTLAVSYWKLRRIPIMPLVTAAIVLDLRLADAVLS